MLGSAQSLCYANGHLRSPKVLRPINDHLAIMSLFQVVCAYVLLLNPAYFAKFGNPLPYKMLIFPPSKSEPHLRRESPCTQKKLILANCLL